VHAEKPPRPPAPAPAHGRPADARRALGRRGEDLAAQHLIGLGYSVLARNVRTRHGEIDLIVFDGEALAFAEVKTRRVNAATAARGSDRRPLAWLGGRQRARLRRLAVAWLSDERLLRPSARTIRFDAIGVTVDGAGTLLGIDHVEGAW
jgi:putative endonuclease